MAPMVVGISTLVGSGSTIGTTSHTDWPLQQRHGSSCPRGWLFAILEPFFVPHGGPVERVGFIHPNLAPNSKGAPKVAVRAISSSGVPD